MDAGILTRFARTLVRYSMNLQPRELVFIRSSSLAIPLVREVYREALLAGAFPQIRISMEESEQILYAEASDDQLDYIFAGDKLEVETADARLTINAPSNTRANSAVDPSRQARRGKALNEIQSIFRRRSTDGTLKWCGTLFP